MIETTMTRRFLARATAAALTLAGAWTLTGDPVGSALAAEMAGEPVGEALRVKGAVSVKRGDETMPLSAGGKLLITDVVTTGADGRAQIRLDDGSVLTMTPGSGYRIAEFQVNPASGHRSVRVTPLSGLINAAVAKAAPGSKFEVELAFSVASVRGTELMFELQSTQCVIFVHEGEISVKHKHPDFHHRHIMMRAGEGTIVRPNAPPTYAARWSDELATRWRDKVRFE